MMYVVVVERRSESVEYDKGFKCGEITAGLRFGR